MNQKWNVIIENYLAYAESKENDKVYELPDGQTVTVGNQRFRCA